MTPIRVGLAAWACLLGGIGASGCTPDPADSGPPNIVLISIDSLRADRLGCYGAERNTSPAIDALAAAGVRFETTVAPSPWTLASHATLFTGLPVSAHRVDAPDRRLDGARHVLADHLSRHGYRTAAFVSSPFLDRAYGLDRGFDVYQNFQATEFPPTEADHDESHADRSADRVIDAALAWLRDASGPGPWFLFVHVWDVHYDYDPPQPFDAMFDPDYTGSLDASRLKHNPNIHAGMSPRDLLHLRALYDGEIRWVDSQLARLFDQIALREANEPILVSLVSDHGEEFFEHGNKAHFKTLFDESLRVPWILRWPGRVAAGSVVRGVAGLEDVAPTLVALAGLPPLAEATGRNLQDAIRSGTTSRPQLLQFGLQQALRGEDWKVALRADREAVYYDLTRDPEERVALPAAQAAPRRLARLRNRIRKVAALADAFEWQTASEIELDEATNARLRELGYVE